jgi:branched-chain amino acid transport system permease protein
MVSPHRILKTAVAYPCGSYILFLLFLGAVPLLTSDGYFLHVGILTMWSAYLACAWNILGGFAGQFSLGHAAFVGSGAYISSLLFINLGLTPWIGMLFGGVGAALLSIVIGYPCFRLRGAYFALSTLAAANVLQILALGTERLFGVQVYGARGIVIPLRGNNLFAFQFVEKQGFYYIILGLLCTVVVISALIKRSKFGYYLSAIRVDQEAANALGVNVRLYKQLCFCLSAFLAAIGGTFYTQYLLLVDPVRVLGADISIETIIVTIVGGKGTIAGPVLGALLLTPLGEIVRATLGSKTQGIHVVVYGLVLIVVMILMPQGLKPPLENICKKVAMRLKKQKRLMQRGIG